MDFEEMFEEGQEGEGGSYQVASDMFMFGMDEKEVEELKQNKDSVVFLIDCHKSMHEQNPHNGKEGHSNIDQILKACLSFMKTKIITSDNDKIGIVLYGCKTSSNSLNFNNIHVFQKLEGPDAKTIKNLEKKMQSFSQEFGYAAKEGETALFEALWICHQEFKTVEKQSYNKRIFLFTNEDNPGTQNDKNMAQQRANDLGSLGVDIELFPMPKPSQQRPSFDVKKFYANIITFDEEEQFSELLGIEGTQNRITELMKRIRQKEFRKRTQGKCLFSLTPKAQVALSFYTTIMPTKKPNASKVNAVNNKQLKSTQRYICQETGTILYPNQIATFYPLGGEKVKMSQDDVKQIKFFDKIGMKLMGFKPRSCLKVFHNIKHSYFIYPDEKRVTGSSQVVDALVKEMNAADKIAIVRFIPRENSAVRFCALIPQEEKYDEEDGFQTPPGFQLIILPYADDIRDLNSIFEAAGFPTDKDDEENIFDSLSKEEKDAAKLLVKNLTIDFNSRNFENPTVQRFYAGLQALALNEEEPEPIDDLLEPDYKGMAKFDPIIQKFKDVFLDGNDEDPVCGGAGKGRGRGTTGGAGRGRARGRGNTQGSQASNYSGKGKMEIISKLVLSDDDDEKELPLPSQTNNKKRKEPPQVIKKANQKKRKIDQSDDDDDDLADFIIDDEEVKPKKGSKAKPQASSQVSKNGKQQNGKSPKVVKDKQELKFQELHKKGQLNSLTVPELKEFLTVKNLPAKGTKKFLVEVIEEYFEDN